MSVPVSRARTALHVLLGAAALLHAATRLHAQPLTNDSTPRRSCASTRPILPAGEAVVAALPHCLPRIEVFAEGNLKDVLGKSEESAVASGAVGMQYFGSRHVVSALVNVAGTNDTVVTDRGATLLVPAVGRGLNAASLVVRTRFRDWTDPACARYRYPLRCNMGFRLEADASTRRWATGVERIAGPEGGPDSVDQVTAIEDVPIWGVGAGVWYSFFDGAIETNDGASRPVALLLDLGLAHRALRGDIAGDDAESRALRESLLGTTRTNFTGFDVGLSLIYDRVRSSFTYLWLSGDADGLTGGQIVASVELRAPLASGLLRRQ